MNAWTESGVFGGHPDIADEGERQPTADGDAGDRGDHRDGELVDAGGQVGQPHLGVVIGLEGRPRSRLLSTQGRPVPLKLSAGAEPASGTGQDRDPERAELIQGVVHAVDQRCVDRVEPLRPVQGDAGDAVLESLQFYRGHIRTVSDSGDAPGNRPTLAFAGSTCRRSDHDPNRGRQLGPGQQCWVPPPRWWPAGRGRRPPGARGRSSPISSPSRWFAPSGWTCSPKWPAASWIPTMSNATWAFRG